MDTQNFSSLRMLSLASHSLRSVGWVGEWVDNGCGAVVMYCLVLGNWSWM